MHRYVCLQAHMSMSLPEDQKRTSVVLFCTIFSGDESLRPRAGLAASKLSDPPSLLLVIILRWQAHMQLLISMLEWELACRAREASVPLPMRHLNPQATCCFVRELGTCTITLHMTMATSTERPIVSIKADFCLARPQGVKALSRRAVSSSSLGPVGPVGQVPGGRVKNNLARTAPGSRQSWFPTRCSKATVLAFTVKLCLLCCGRASHLELSSAFRHENPSWTIPEPCQKITLANHNDIKRDCVPGSQTILSLQQLSGRKPS